MQSANQNDRKQKIQKILELLETADDRKINNIYHFVMHIAK